MIDVAISGPLRQTGGGFTAMPPFSAYSHTIEAVGGFWSAEIGYAANESMMEDWIVNGCGRHVRCTSDLAVCWEGFVNEVVCNYGPLTVTRGPLMDVANRVEVVFSGVDIDTNPPTVGIQMTVGPTDNDDSIDRYGILYKMVSAGQVSATEAAQIRDQYLVEHRHPSTTKEWNAGGSGDLSITLRCLGYVHWLDYPYSQTAAMGYIDASDKIIAMVAANPNIAWLPFSTTNVAPNTLDVYRYEYEKVTAWELIKDIAARGDASYNRWIFGVYGDLVCRYRAAPTEVEYIQYLHDPANAIRMPGGGDIDYADVRPGKWLRFGDFLFGAPDVGDLKDDPRCMFIEAVTYTAPHTLNLRGGKSDQLAQLLSGSDQVAIGA